MTAHTMDEHVRSVSAFKSYADLIHSITEHGYVPTLNYNGTTRANWEFNRSIKLLRDTLVSDGYRVFPEEIEREDLLEVVMRHAGHNLDFCRIPLSLVDWHGWYPVVDSDGCLTGEIAEASETDYAVCDVTETEVRVHPEASDAMVKEHEPYRVVSLSEVEHVTAQSASEAVDAYVHGYETYNADGTPAAAGEFYANVYVWNPGEFDENSPDHVFALFADGKAGVLRFEEQ